MMPTHDVGKLDICVVTKNVLTQEWLDRLRYLPVNRLIVERTKPLGLARMRAIQKVTTPWFIFLDDDAYIGRHWFSQVTAHVAEKVGAIDAYALILVPPYWQEIFDKRFNELRPFKLQPGQRGYTVCTLLRTDLVKDWKPSRNDLSACEDYELTQHILRKGYDWVRVPADALHDSRSVIKLWRHAIWAIGGLKKVTYVSARQRVRNVYRCIGILVVNLMKLLGHLCRRRKVNQTQYWLVIYVANLLGWMFA
jgi:glycosyltransferase involved in cell wall biosynthesis